MLKILRPTLVGRVVLALMMAFFIAWMLLSAVMYIDATDPAIGDKSIEDVGRGLAASLARLDNAQEARAVAAATSEQIEQLYRAYDIPAIMLIQLNAQDGTRLYSSPAGGPALLRGDAGAMTTVRMGGRSFRVFKGTAGRWSVTVAGSRVADSFLLLSIARDLVYYLLIAFPCILLPVWIAVSRGMRPLQQMSKRIAARGTDDMSPTGVDPKYAELRPLAGALDRLLGQLREKIAREHGFVQDAAHELRTPMAVISVNAHVLAIEPEAQGRREAQRHLDHAIARASHLISQLLQLARVDGTRIGDTSVIDVAHLVRHELARAAQAAMDNDIELALEAPERLPFTLEVHAFQSILANLLDNALRYAGAGANVVVGLGREDGCLTLAVADDGPGIAQADLAHVFERFYRARSHNTTGSGLGLAIVRQAALRMDGTVALEPGPGGRGCRFVVRIAAPR
ncbi:HAMP domain-containing histidine kinase [Massilia violaceinigra]|uniref:histidine kinase n=1 Tax=Massilia violaceinigra TaxID=2045208 RepID=A0ABY4A0J5_9BURK|nr:HAMP domain-containing sensor histidine kinase [Massilia violaceinigra]UOD28270.1 HAMP domain-containing histidine kinase [Massilia violaceinigra]